MKMALISEVQWCRLPGKEWSYSFPPNITGSQLGRLTHGEPGIDYLENDDSSETQPKFNVEPVSSHKTKNNTTEDICELLLIDGSIEPLELTWQFSEGYGIKARVIFQLESIYTDNVTPTSYRCWGGRHQVKCRLVDGQSASIWPSVLYALRLWNPCDAPLLWIDCLSMHLAGHSFQWAIEKYLRDMYVQRPRVKTASAIWMYSPWRLREYIRRGWAFQELQLSQLSNATLKALSLEMCCWALDNYEWRPQMERIYNERNRNDRHLIVHFVIEALSGIGATDGKTQVTPVIETIRSESPDPYLVEKKIRDILKVDQEGKKLNAFSENEVTKSLMKRNYIAAEFLNEKDRTPAIFGTLDIPPWFDEVYCDVGPRLTVARNLKTGACGKLLGAVYDVYRVLENNHARGYGVWLTRPHNNKAHNDKLSVTFGICWIENISQHQQIQYGETVGITEELQESMRENGYEEPRAGAILSRSLASLYRMCIAAQTSQRLGETQNTKTENENIDPNKQIPFRENYILSEDVVLKFAEESPISVMLDCTVGRANRVRTGI